ncbi:hypothetical protein LTR94_025204, partial [Friedmanniomyces endolithicus]
VAILDKGKVIAQGRVSELTSAQERLRLTVTPLATALGVLGDNASLEGEALYASIDRSNAPAVLRALVQAGVDIEEARWAEAYRLCQNWLQVVVAVLIVPVIVIVGGAAILHQAAAKGGAAAAAVGMDPAAPSSPLNMMEAFSFAAAHSANGVTLIMMLIAAATLYAGDYRWETWRLISARNDRTSLLLGKVAVMKLLALTGMATFLFSSIVYSLIKAGVFERSLSFSADRGELIAFGLVWILSWVRILQFTMFALLAGVLSRSLLFALIAPWALGFGQQLLGAAGRRNFSFPVSPTTV